MTHIIERTWDTTPLYPTPTDQELEADFGAGAGLSSSFRERYREKVATLDAAGSLLIGLFGALIAWRTAVGAVTLHQTQETSMILGWPIWIAQALMVPGFALLAIVGFYMCGHLLHLVFGRIK